MYFLLALIELFFRKMLWQSSYMLLLVENRPYHSK